MAVRSPARHVAGVNGFGFVIALLGGGSVAPVQADRGSAFGCCRQEAPCGLASPVAEGVEYGSGDERIAAFDEVMVFAELVEMIGALLVGLALLTALQALSPRARA